MADGQLREYLSQVWGCECIVPLNIECVRSASWTAAATSSVVVVVLAKIKRHWMMGDTTN